MGRERLARRYLVVLVATILGFTVLYWVGMSVFEGEPRTLLDSLEVVMQTFTTVGYGQDAPWESPVMTLLVIAMQVGSLLLIFSAFPAVIVPLFEDSLSTSPPAAREGLSDHVVVCTATTHTTSLIEELDARAVPYVIVEPDRETATSLYERDRAVVHGDPESMETLENVAVGRARAVVCDDDDDVDMSIITAVRELAPEVPVYSIARDDDYLEYHDLAGADQVFLPRKLLGRGLANKVRNTVTTEGIGAEAVGDAFDIAEISIARGSDLDGARLGSGEALERLEANVIGVWSRGRFHTPPYTDVALDDQAVLLAVGRTVALEALARSAGSAVRTYDRGRVVVAGFGVVGTIVGDALVQDGIDATVIDASEGARIGVVGDATDEAVLEEAGIGEARTLVLALDDDTTTLVASFIARTVAPDVEIVARANDAESVPKLYRAGADYVLTLSTVAGRLLAAAILESGESVSLDRQIRLVDRDPGDLAGLSLDEAAIRQRTGCTVVAIEHRDGRVSADLRAWSEIETGDRLVVAGVEEALEKFDDLR
ncbi:MAG: TrkA family potassium uptake protein [Salinirussus sp.]